MEQSRYVRFTPQSGHIGTVVEPSLEWFAPIKDDFSIDHKFLKPPTLYLGKIRANKSGRSDKFVGGTKN
jgi:hypothetical protein